jgi:hypothetical protein
VFATKLQGPRINACLYLCHVIFFFNLQRKTNPLIAQKHYTAHTIGFNRRVVIRIRKNLLLCARMRTSDHTSPMQRINCLVPTSPVQPLAPPPTPNILLPTETTHVAHFNDRRQNQHAGFFFSAAQSVSTAWQRNKIQTAGIKAGKGKQQ